MEPTPLEERLAALKLERQPDTRHRLRWLLAPALFVAGFALAVWWRAAPAPPAGSASGSGAAAAERPGGAGTGSASSSVAAAAVAARASEDVTALEFKGYIRAHRVVSISSSMSGRLMSIAVREGDRVRRGQVLALLDGREIDAQVEMARAQLEQARWRIQEAELQLQKARDDTRRVQGLAAQGMVSDAALSDAQFKSASAELQLKAAQASARVQQAAVQAAEVMQANTVIRAPQDGLVTALSASPGEVVTPLSAVGSSARSGICTLADMSLIDVELEVPERLIGRIGVGQAVLVVPDAYPALRLTGQVSSVGAAATRGSATVPVRVRLDPQPAALLPDMSANVAWRR